jgi:hypothetical protein
MSLMEHETPRFWRRAGRNTFVACVGLLLGPSLLVWAVRGIAAAAQCAPGPELCRGVALGGALREVLSLAWALGTNTWLLLGVAVLAALAAMFMRRPLLGATTLLILPLAALTAPMAAVYSALYQGCIISESGVGDCLLWGAQMGTSFHNAANVPWLIYGFAPFSFALSLVLGILGWFIVRKSPGQGQASTRSPGPTSFRVPDYKFTDRDRP